MYVQVVCPLARTLQYSTVQYSVGWVRLGVGDDAIEHPPKWKNEVYRFLLLVTDDFSLYLCILPFVE